MNRRATATREGFAKTHALPLVLACLIFAFALAASEAAGFARIEGVVVGLQADDIVLRHEAFGDMPAMTMPFHVLSAPGKLRLGDHIAGLVDTAHEPLAVRVTEISPAPATPVLPAPTPWVAHRRVGDAAPEGAFIDQAGKPRSFADLRRSVVILSFIYTRCPDPRMCPLISAKFARLRRMLPARFILAEFTLDPEHDRPATLRAYGRLFGAHLPGWILATGSSDQMRAIAGAFGVEQSPSGAGLLTHGAVLAVVDETGRIADEIEGVGWTPEQVAAEALRAADSRTHMVTRASLWISQAFNDICGFNGNGSARFLRIAQILAALGIGYVLIRMTLRLLTARLR